MACEHFDVVIVGAGLSGIGAGYHLQTRCPDRSYVILENRQAIGGTWDIFRYPGIRSDSDMYTLGYAFKPWAGDKTIADGASILDYVRGTAAEHGIDRKVRFGHRVTRADWSTAEARWTVEAEHEGETLRFTCAFLFLCGGYYSYGGGHQPDLPGRERFQGRVIHPQAWDEGYDYSGQQVVVIGSGATAVTLVPEMAKAAAHVTMLQRSPTYMVARPSKDRLANALRRVLPAMAAYQFIRWRNVLLVATFFRLAKRQPGRVRRGLIRRVRRALGRDYDVATHFTPRYDPWDQRLCLVPDGDLFKAVRSGRASVVTDQVVAFTGTGVRLASGRELPADLVVTATGLELVVWNGIEVWVDGRKVEAGRTLAYKAMMFEGVPNMALAFGYTNASWTLKADLTCAFVCRILNHMAATGLRQATPVNTDPTVEPRPWVNFTSGYVVRALERLPKQGSKPPWRMHQSYVRDVMSMRFDKLEDGVLRFSNLAKKAKAAA